jgi:hypothetical protein
MTKTVNNMVNIGAGIGVAQLIRLGWFRPVHAKSIESQEMQA